MSSLCDHNGPTAMITMKQAVNDSGTYKKQKGGGGGGVFGIQNNPWDKTSKITKNSNETQI